MNIIFYTRTPWNEPPRARHQLAQAMSKFHQVIFIEANKTGFFSIKKTQLNDSLTILTPKFPIANKYRFRIPILNEIYQIFIARKINRIFQNEKFFVITFDQTSHLFCQHINFPYLYYVNDDHSRSYGVPFLKAYFDYTENKVSKNAQSVIVTANSLLDKLFPNNKNTYLVKLGAPETDKKYLVSKQFLEKKLIKVAWVGFIGKKNDFSIIEKLLTCNNFEVHFFGKVDSSIHDHYGKSHNFINHGIVTDSALIKMLSALDVGIAPYSIHDVNSGGTPNKLWVYLASGLPVVTTELLNIRTWQFPEGFVYKTQDNANFLELIKTAIDDDNEELRMQRFNFAKKNSWNNRAEEISKLIS